MNAVSLTPRGDGAYQVTGELTFATVPGVWRETQAWFAPGRALAIDLGGVSRADSAALALLLEWRRAGGRHGAAVRFEHVPAQILALARLTALEPLLVPEV